MYFDQSLRAALVGYVFERKSSARRIGSVKTTASTADDSGYGSGRRRKQQKHLGSVVSHYDEIDKNAGPEGEECARVADEKARALLIARLFGKKKEATPLSEQEVKQFRTVSSAPNSPRSNPAGAGDQAGPGHDS
jgi:hypothetical protein